MNLIAILRVHACRNRVNCVPIFDRNASNLWPLHFAKTSFLDSSFLRSDANVEQQSDANSVCRVGFRTTPTLSNHNKRLRFKRNQRLHVQLRPRDIPLRSARPQQRVVVWRSRVSNEWVFLLRTESGATSGEIQNLTMRRIHNEKRTRSGTNRARVRRGGMFR